MPIPIKTRRATLALMSGLLGCHKAAAPGNPGASAPPDSLVVAAAPAPRGHVEGTPHTDAVQNAWREAGLAPEGFAPLQPVPYGAATCEEGRVQGLDTVVCEFRDQDSLAKGQSSLLEQWGREGGHTGVAYHQKLTVVGVVDRARHDPNGKVIHQVIDSFRKL
ncbi:MAG TPA: hypothetical protein VHH90_10295 [Polyangia bacterium]|nr:hypothetical protein [Polyangia bacterium]